MVEVEVALATCVGFGVGVGVGMNNNRWKRIDDNDGRRYVTYLCLIYMI